MNTFSCWNWNVPSEATMACMKVLFCYQLCRWKASLFPMLPASYASRRCFWTSVASFASWQGWTDEPYALLPEVSVFILKRRWGRNGNFLTKCLAQTTLLKEGEQPHPLPAVRILNPPLVHHPPPAHSKGPSLPPLRWRNGSLGLPVCEPALPRRHNA